MINWFLKRPVSLICIYAIIMVMGIVSLFRLPVELYPDVEFPSLSIRFYWSGASAEAVERYITRKVEAGVYKLNGVKNVESTSERGECSVDVDFERETDVAYQRVLLSEELLREKFPYGVKGPYFSEKIPEEIKRGEPFVLYITGPYSIKDIGEYARRLKIFLSRVDGIKDINIYGNVEEIIKIKITNELFKPVELVRKLQEKRIAGGSVELEGREISVTCVPYQKINDIRIRGMPINKIADIQYVYKEPAVLSRINGNPQISLNISKRPGSNILKMSKDIRKIIKIFPMKNGMKIIVARDEADIIRDTMRKIMLLGIISIFGVGIALFLFFKKIYNVVVFTLSIIFSTLLTFSLLYFSKLSLNALTLSGIALGFGMLVDNSIIVLENIMRMKEIKEKNPEFKGASDVFIAVLASTITTISVYIPFLYFQGKLRIFYKQFALSSTFALLSSIFVAFTLIPSLSRKVYPEKGIVHIFYKNLLQKVLRWRWVILGITTILIIVSIFLFKDYVYKGEIFSFTAKNELYIYIKLPPGAERNETIKMTDRFEKEIKRSRGIKNFYTEIYRRSTYININFRQNAGTSPSILKEKLENLATNYANCRITILGMGPMFYTGSGRTGGYPEISIKGYDYYWLKILSKRVGKKLSENPRIRDIDLNFSWYGKQREYIISPSENLPILGFNPYSLLTNIGLYSYSTIEMKNRVIPVEVFRDSLIELGKIPHIRLTEGIETGDVSKITVEKSPSAIKRENQEYKMDIAYTFRGPWKMAYNFKKAFLHSIVLPEGFSIGPYSFKPSEKGIRKSTIVISVVLSLFLLMVILSSLYESFAKPLIILLTLPFSFIGIVFIYLFTGINFDSSAFVGVILFSGIAVNDGIVLIDHLSKGKKQTKDEIIERSSHRLRPIFMTSITTIMGLIPFLFLKSEGVLLSKLSLSAIGGLIFSTVGSVILIPLLYYTFFRKKE